MRLERLQLHNWRCFPICDIDLDQDITVLIGQNGSGKTALLNAFVWGLYGETTDGFSEPHDLCNHQAKYALEEGQATSVEVSVVFRHDSGQGECRYVAQRKVTVERTGSGDTDFEESMPQFVLNRYPTGQPGNVGTASADSAEKEIREILPVGLSPYFFFPAENIGAAIGAPDARASSVEQAVDILLGTRRLGIARATIREALQLRQLKEKKSDDLRLAKAQQNAETAREAYEEVASRLEELPEEIRRARGILAKAEESLQRSQDANRLVNERNEIQRLYDEAKTDAERAETKQREILNNECFNLFGQGVLSCARKVLDEAKAEGRIPPKVAAGVLDDLIENAERCLCGQPITESERQVLRMLRSTVVEDALAEIASTVWARVVGKDEQLSDRSEDETSHSLLLAAEKSMHDAHAVMKTQLNKREEFDQEHPLVQQDAALQDPFETWKKFRHTCDGLEDEQRDLKRQQPELLQKKRDAANEHHRLQNQQGKADKVREARNHLESVEKVVEDLQNRLRSRSRADIERAINDIAHDVLLRNYTIRLTADFELEARQDGVRIGAASSERAWVTFAFVAALSGLIEEYNRFEDMDEAGNTKLEKGTGYPLVLDAPFSPFGDEYASEFAERLAELVPQSVLIIRQDQIRHLDPIMTSDAGVRGYLMCFFGPRDIEQTITWGDGECWGDGSLRPYVVPAETSDHVRTEIMELPA